MSIRTERVSEEIKHRMNSAMSKDLMEIHAGLVTVSRVIMSPDLKIAKVYVSFLGNKESAEKLVERINNRKSHIRFLLGKQLTLKYTPDLIFFYDDSMEYADKINKLLNEVKKNETKENTIEPQKDEE